MTTGPAGTGAPPPLLRGAAVIGLLAAAALAVEARHGLDWERLSDRAALPWLRLVVGLAFLVLLAGALRRLLRRLKVPERRSDEAPPVPPPGKPPRGLRLLVVLVGAAILALVWWVIRTTTDDGRRTPARLRPGPAREDTGESLATASVDWLVLYAVAAALLGLVVVGRVLAGRRPGGTAWPPSPEEPEPDAATLAAAAAAAQQELAVGTDVRGSIVAAYRAMAAEIGTALAGAARRSDTPSQFLDRAVQAGLVAPGPAGELTTLFREARFSRHPMGEPDRAAAMRALHSVLDELQARRG